MSENLIRLQANPIYAEWGYQNPPLSRELQEEIDNEPDAKCRKVLQLFYESGLTAPPHLLFKFTEGSTPLSDITRTPVFTNAYDLAGEAYDQVLEAGTHNTNGDTIAI